MSYDLRRLRLRGLIVRVPHPHRYQVTDEGFRIELFFLKVHARILRPGLASIAPDAPVTDVPLWVAFEKLETEIHRVRTHAQLTA